jgi:hypothetical protein
MGKEVPYLEENGILSLPIDDLIIPINIQNNIQKQQTEIFARTMTTTIVIFLYGCFFRNHID